MGPTSEMVEPPAQFAYTRGYGQMDYEQPMFQVMKDVSNNPRTHRDRGEEWWTIGQGDCGGV